MIIISLAIEFVWYYVSDVCNGGRYCWHPLLEVLPLGVSKWGGSIDSKIKKY